MEHLDQELRSTADTVETIRNTFHGADGILILAGAGMGVESGIPDFRGDSGLWTEAKENFNFNDVAIQAARFKSWLSGKKNIVGIEIGAGQMVPSIRHLSLTETSMLVRINPHDYQVNRPQDVSIAEPAIKGISTLNQLLI